jgi:hypothetical protein
MLQTEIVVKALERFRENRWDEVRTLGDLEQLLASGVVPTVLPPGSAAKYVALDEVKPVIQRLVAK